MLTYSGGICAHVLQEARCMGCADSQMTAYPPSVVPHLTGFQSLNTIGEHMIGPAAPGENHEKQIYKYKHLPTDTSTQRCRVHVQRKPEGHTPTGHW